MSGVSLFFLVSLILGLIICEASGLTCYTCTAKWEFDACVVESNSSAVQICSSNETFCLVNRNETNGIFTKLKRGCSSSCRPGCGVWGGNDVDIESCVSCCTSDLCNTGNGVAIMKISVPVVFLVVLCAFRRS